MEQSHVRLRHLVEGIMINAQEALIKSNDVRAKVKHLTVLVEEKVQEAINMGNYDTSLNVHSHDRKTVLTVMDNLRILRYKTVLDIDNNLFRVSWRD